MSYSSMCVSICPLMSNVLSARFPMVSHELFQPAYLRRLTIYPLVLIAGCVHSTRNLYHVTRERKMGLEDPSVYEGRGTGRERKSSILGCEITAQILFFTITWQTTVYSEKGQ